MKKTSQWFTPLAILAATSLAWTSPSVANEAYPTASVDYFQGQQSIPIGVDAPEMEETPNNNDNFGNFGSPIYQGTCPATLDPIVRRIIGSDTANRWGILVETLQDGKILYNHNGDRNFIPASNNKIFTTAAALQRLSPDTPIKSNVSLQQWVMVTNKRSHNGYADTLMRYIGGPGAAKATLTQLGVDPRSFRLADGSGLSRANTTTPRALVDTLRAMYSSPQGELFVASLPVAGMNGTLTRRMRSTPAQGNVYAKTGTLTGVRALSGYINNSTYGTLVFSILANDSRRPGTSLVHAIDQIVVQLNMMNQCN
ncbi:MAG: D-alanyl-D-alanine carboxypeptidase/D-alanyl-D-alanine-endopeptidase [Woronichinia naegeliana WA131]|jgi:D-alanyl-D-alanine carboxypeptidase/D-alanyl-D-alanine-endopeptidase (penicillin-binding protein 4)|uniref:D-alanyl-D-alanine carboxypeptidase/D-alanyl-D-alanine-endopeptidase n=1 Tax=Woronichinia naegeliana WA131 TaxID=2824559 RepID=A0A977PU59_9CYAN|nr:MAG: D-alanyl-D-alanine carboxypeptidase/D-alanyl-D-alanine-endopeptidase [Woronichinia naegeliana WA131]